MKKEIQLSNTLEFPLSAVTQTFAFLGRRGSGKTYGASKLAEEMLFAGAQIIVVDPMGVWYGLRLDATGKKPSGLQIPVFGGLHGDLPLTPDSGALVADIIVDRRIPAILDVSQMIDSEINRFTTAFGDRLFQRMKASPAPLHLFLEECQEFLPQNVMKGEERKLHVFQRLSRQGRSFGIGVSLISQRPQDINKKALNMSEVMLAFQMTGPQERKAIEAWISDKGLDLDIVNALPKFKVGQPHVWSPQWLGISQQIVIAHKRTYDASATPEFGSERIERRELTPVDVEAIKGSMRDLIEQTRENDPTELKREIARLRRDLASKPGMAQKEVQRIEVQVPVFQSGEIARLEKAIADYTEASMLMASSANEIKIALDAARRLGAVPGKRFEIPAARNKNENQNAISVQSMGALTAPQQRILDAIAWMESVNLRNPKRTVIAFLARQSPKSSGYKNNLSSLKSQGLIVYSGSDAIQFTDAGRSSVSQVMDTPMTANDVQGAILSRLPRPQARILEYLINAYPSAAAREEVAQAAGQSPNSSGYKNNLSALRSLGVIEYDGSQAVKALPVLFLES